MSATTRAPRAAYLHVPFCAHRCGYCNFTLVAGRDDLIDGYLQALERELAALEGPHEVDTLFFGGGTPTQLRGASLARLLELTKRAFPLAAGHEFSVEANPADLDDEMLGTLAAAGVNRISLGGQSFDSAKLKALERDHTPEVLARALELSRKYVPAVSQDLIFGVPGETLHVWEQDLVLAVGAKGQHISTYGLTFERGTSFWTRLSHGELKRADEELERSMYLAAIDTLTAAGFEHYEISNFAYSGFRCRHNEVYWAGESYFAAGPGAARYVNGIREMNHRSTTTYIKRMLAGESPVAEREQLEPEDRAREMLVFGLRRIRGVDQSEFAAKTGYTIDELIAQPLERYLKMGLFHCVGSWLRLTREGLLVSDSIWPDFLRS